MRPLWSRAVAIVVAIVAVAISVVVLDRGSYVATLRIERHEPPIDRPAHEVPLITRPELTHRIPPSRIHASHALAEGSLLGTHTRTGELRAMYGHASATNVGTSMQPRSRQIVLRDPRPEPGGPGVVSAVFLRPLFGRDPGPAETEVGMLRALEDREALALLVAEAAPRGEGAQPFRGEG